MLQHQHWSCNCCDKPLCRLTMLPDCMLWLGLTTACILFILLGCKLLIDFPGLMEGDIGHACVEDDQDEDSIQEVVAIKDGKCKIYAASAVQSSNHQLDNTGGSTLRLMKRSQSIPRPVGMQCNSSRPLQRHSIASRPDVAQSPSSLPIVAPSHASSPVFQQSYISSHVVTQSCVPSATKPGAAVPSLSVSFQPLPGQVTSIQIKDAEISIVIKKLDHGKDFSINIEFSEEKLNYSCETPADVVADVREAVSVTPEVSKEVTNDDPVQCHFYNTQQNTKRDC